jgi:hypothetical protein
MPSLAERYEAGEHEAVWAELRSLGSDVFEPDVLPDAERVADLTMQRAATNVALLVVKLTAMGYRFGDRFVHNRRRQAIEDLNLRDSMEKAGRDVAWVDAGDVEETVMGWSGPRPDINDRLERAEKAVGPLPLALRALVRHIDAVDLAGSFPSWNPGAYDFDDGGEWPVFGVVSDAFNIIGIDVVEDFLKPGTDEVLDTYRDETGRLPLPVKADHVLSANIAGGYCTVSVPDPVADPILEGAFMRPGTTLVEYLRASFRWGGFPGFEFVSDPPPEIEILRRGLLPL